MKCSPKTRLFLLKTDLVSCARDHRKEFLVKCLFMLLGVGLGVYIGVKIGANEGPFSVFAKLFCLSYTPFSLLFGDLLRLLFYSILTVLGFFLPPCPLYSSAALFLLGKYYGELACLSFLTDSVLAAVLSLILIYLPLLLIGGVVLMRISLYSSDFRLSCGTERGARSFRKTAGIVGKALLVLLLALFLLYVVLCGVIYLTILSV